MLDMSPPMFCTTVVTIETSLTEAEFDAQPQLLDDFLTDVGYDLSRPLHVHLTGKDFKICQCYNWPVH